MYSTQQNAKPVASQEKIAQMLENCNHFDKDIRHTGAHDLCKLVSTAENLLDESLEKRICAAFVQHLEDKSVEVRSNAVKCTQLVSSKIRVNNLLTILDKMMTEIVSGSPETTDIFALTVRGIVSECNDLNAAPSIIQKIYQNLIGGILSKHENVTWECLEICTEIFKKFGLLIQRQQNLVDKQSLMSALNTQLSRSDSPKITKSASLAMGAFAIILNHKQLESLVTLLMNKISQSTDKYEQTTQVQCLSIMAKSIGSKLPLLPTIVERLQQIMMNLDQEQSNDDANELSEACLTTLATIVRKCSREVAPFIDQLLQNSLTLISYDPNYLYNDDEQEDADMEDEEEGWGSDNEWDDDEADVGDNEDSSWKVRRGAIFIIDSVVKTRHDYLSTITNNHGALLVDRFKERVNDVKVCLLETFQSILQESVELAPQTLDLELSQTPSLLRTRSYGATIKDLTQKISTALVKQMQTKNLKVRIAVSQTLAQLAVTVQFSLDQYFDTIWPEFQKTIDDTQSFEPAINTLKVLRRLFRSTKEGSSTNFHNSANSITNFLVKAISHDYSQVISHGLRVSGSFLNSLRQANHGTIDPKFASVTQHFHNAILDKLNKVDIDQEVKQCSILAASSLVNVCHTQLSQPQKETIFNLFNNRLSNELTRDAALKGLTTIAQNQNSAEVIPISNITIFLPHFFDLLKKAQRQLHLYTLECLEAFTRRYGGQLQSSVGQISQEVAHMIREEDFQRSVLALNVSSNLISVNKAEPSLAIALNKAIDLAGAENHDRTVQNALQDLFSAASKAGIVSQEQLNRLQNSISLKSRGGAACLAIAIKNQYGQLFNNLWQMDPNNAQMCIAHLLTIGEYGKITDLSQDARLLPTVQQMFDHPQNDVRLAASITLGNVTVGNPDAFLDQVFDLVVSSQDKKYLFMNTLREIIIENPKCLNMHLDRALDLLMAHSSHNEEGIRNIVAESLGRLTPHYEEDIYSTLQAGLQSNEVLKKATISKSIKLSGPKIQSTIVLATLIEGLVLQQQATDPEVLKNSLEALTSIIHSCSTKVKGELRTLVPNIENFGLAETAIREELIEIVELGPIKHKVDKGLPIRKAAFQLLENLYDYLASEIEINKVLDVIVGRGLEDAAEECVVLTLNILAKLSSRSGVVVLSAIDQIILAFEKLYKQNLKLIASKQSQERAQNILRAVIRVVYIINNSPEQKENPSAKFEDFYRIQVMANGDSKNLYEKVAASYKSYAFD